MVNLGSSIVSGLAESGREEVLDSVCAQAACSAAGRGPWSWSPRVDRPGIRRLGLQASRGRRRVEAASAVGQSSLASSESRLERAQRAAQVPLTASESPNGPVT